MELLDYISNEEWIGHEHNIMNVETHRPERPHRLTPIVIDSSDDSGHDSPILHHEISYALEEDTFDVQVSPPHRHMSPPRHLSPIASPPPQHFSRMTSPPQHFSPVTSSSPPISKAIPKIAAVQENDINKKLLQRGEAIIKRFEAMIAAKKSSKPEEEIIIVSSSQDMNVCEENDIVIPSRMHRTVSIAYTPDEDSDDGVPEPPSLSNLSIHDDITMEIDENVNTPKDERCFICRDGNSWEGDPILFCDVCNVAVHQFCYGVESIPMGEWHCEVRN